jgi:hypothetical protein
MKSCAITEVMRNHKGTSPKVGLMKLRPLASGEQGTLWRSGTDPSFG